VALGKRKIFNLCQESNGNVSALSSYPSYWPDYITPAHFLVQSNILLLLMLPDRPFVDGKLYVRQFMPRRREAFRLKFSTRPDMPVTLIKSYGRIS
jgi:hypothetical protein